MKKKILPFILSVVMIVPLFSFTGTSQDIAPLSLVNQSTSTYYLRNAKSGLYLDLQSSGATNGTHFQQYPYGDQSEMFQITYSSTTNMISVKTTLTYASGTMVMDV